MRKYEGVKAESKSALAEALRSVPNGVILGESTEGARLFHYFDIGHHRIGLISSGLSHSGYSPVACDLGETVIVPYDSMIGVVDKDTGSVEERHLDGCFFGITDVSGGVLVVNEIGAELLNPHGARVWSSAFPGIIDGYKIDGDALTVVDLDSSVEHSFALDTGRSLE